MDSKRWHELRHLFDTAVELPRHLWNDYLFGASSDAALRCEVADLLDMDARLSAGDVRLDRVSTSAVAMAAHLAGTRADPRIGSVVGSWRILRALGQGSGGVVYLAEPARASAQVHVALKLPLPDAPASARERFRAERDVLRQLRFPGVVRLLDADIDAAAGPCLVFEHVDGRDVLRHCALQQLGPVARLRLFVRICDIVALVHAAGVAHRDLRAQNILVTRDGAITLLDFGRATWLGAGPACDDASVEPAGDTLASCDDARAAMIACDVRTLGHLLRALWPWPGLEHGAAMPATGDRSLAALVRRAVHPAHSTLSDLSDELRIALAAPADHWDDNAQPSIRDADAADATLLHCALAKSARQSRRSFGSVEESPGSAGQSAR